MNLPPSVRAAVLEECDGCLTPAFLRPVDVFPGFAGPDCLVTLHLCLSCRLGVRDDRWISLVSTFLHHPNREMRECASWALEWTAREEVAEALEQVATSEAEAR